MVHLRNRRGILGNRVVNINIELYHMPVTIYTKKIKHTHTYDTPGASCIYLIEKAVVLSRNCQLDDSTYCI